MSDRRALILGSWLAKGRNIPTPQKVKSITHQWSEIFKQDHYGFRSLMSRGRKPKVVHNPERGQLTTIFEHAQSISDQTELLLYFLGHSAPSSEDDLRLILSLDSQGEDRPCSLRWLLSTIHDSTEIRRLIIILDTCHAGRARETFRLTEFDYYAMLATGSAYAFDARFSEGILKALQKPLRKNDQRIDRSAGGITYRKVFEFARRYVIEISTADKAQVPREFGDHSSDLLLEAPVVVPKGFNQFASDRTIYGRLFRLLELVKLGGELTFGRLQKAVHHERTFLLRRDEHKVDQYLSSERLMNYLDFLRRARWIIQPSGKYRVTTDGLKACNRSTWNRRVLDAIETSVFPDDLTMEFLDKIVSDLVVDMIPPTPVNIKKRAGMKGVSVSLDPATRIALQVLPSTGRFVKGSADAIFPSERGGA